MKSFNENNGDPLPTNSPSAPGLWESWSTQRILGLALLLIAGNFFFQILVYAIGGGLFLPVLAGAVGGVFLPLWLLARRHGLNLSRDLRLNLPSPEILLASGAVAVATLVPTSLLAELSLRLHPMDPAWATLFRDNLPDTPFEYGIAIVAVVLAAPLAEEIIFRGLLHRLASRFWGGLAAAVLSSLLFALVHSEPWFLFGLLGIGLALALVFEITGSVTACWITHAVHNGISMGLMIAGGKIEAEPGPITLQDWGWCGVSVLALLALAYWLRSRSTSSKSEARDRY